MVVLGKDNFNLDCYQDLIMENIKYLLVISAEQNQIYWLFESQ